MLCHAKENDSEASLLQMVMSPQVAEQRDVTFKMFFLHEGASQQKLSLETNP